MNDAYDPQESDEGRKGTQYISRKDVRIIGIVVFVLGLIAWPLYLHMLKGVNQSLCSRNFRKMAIAMQEYKADFDDHLPFAYETASYGGSDIKLRGGYPYTWQWTLQPFTNDWKVFRCPAAEAVENSLTSDGSQIQGSSYGMLNAYSGIQYSMIANPASKILISETVRNGALGTLDPLPLQTPIDPANPSAGMKTIQDDGFVIGFDNNQTYPNVNTQFATRLAFPDAKTAGLDQATSRHPDGIHFLTVDGTMWTKTSEAARVSSLVGSFGTWDVPKPLRTIR
jgi:hypothetical protein